MSAEGRKGPLRFVKDTCGIFIKNAYQFFLLVLVAYVPIIIMHVLLLTGIDPGSAMKGDDALAGRQFIVFYLLYILICAAALFLLQIALIKKIRAVDQGLDLKPAGAYKQAFALMGPYLFVFLLVLVKILLWSLLLIVPGIVFAVFYSFSYFALILDDCRGTKALAFSKSLIKPNFWRFLGYSLVIWTILLLIGFVIGALMQLLFGFGSPGAVGFIPRLGEGLNGLLSGFFGVIATVFFYRVYEEFKINSGSAETVVEQTAPTRE